MRCPCCSGKRYRGIRPQSLTEPLLHENADIISRAVIQCSEHSVAELFIEALRLERKRREPGSDTAPIGGDCFCTHHELGPEIAASHALWHDKVIYEQPFIDGSAPQASDRVRWCRKFGQGDKLIPTWRNGRE